METNGPEKFDAITSDPLDPWVKGAATLYTVSLTAGVGIEGSSQVLEEDMAVLEIIGVLVGAGVQVARRLVGDDQSGIGDDGPRDADALLLATG